MIDKTGLDDGSAVQDVAGAWVETLTSRGVTLRLRGKGQRLELVPARAYGELSDDELLTLRHYREAIKQVVRERYAGTAKGVTVTPARASFVAPAEPVPPTPCPYCNRSPCIGVEHPAFYSLHPQGAQARDNARLNQEFRLAFGLTSGRDDPREHQ